MANSNIRFTAGQGDVRIFGHWFSIPVSKTIKRAGNPRSAADDAALNKQAYHDEVCEDKQQDLDEAIDNQTV